MSVLFWTSGIERMRGAGMHIYRCRVFVLFLLVLLTACQGQLSNTTQSSLGGLRIVQFAAALGGTQQQGSYQYTVSLVNGTNQELTIVSITPVVTPAFMPRVDPHQLPVPVGQPLAAGGTMEINGTIRFQASDLSKQQINELMPVVTGIRIISEQQLSVPGQE
jgi:hypothetical protein